MNIAMLLSGGVDSSVALARLIDAGHNVTAFYMKIWLEDDMAYLGTCPWEEDLRYAQAVCDQLQVPLHVVPLQKAYHERVVSYTIAAVRAGLTPNPDMLCNHEVKFGVFDDMYGKDFDAIATGHYAQTQVHADGSVHLLRAPDAVKDQTYFLALLTQEQLKKALFPIGDMRKSDVRAHAQALTLPTAARKDSQGICFLGKISFADFIKHHLGTRPGIFIEKETGKKLGTHDGFYFYTIGQRRGIPLNCGPWYVCDKDPTQNIVYVTHGFAGVDQGRDTLRVVQINWIGVQPDKENVQVKLRHGPQMYDCVITPEEKPDTVHVRLAIKDQAIAPGQYAVFYDGERCLGGGVIQ